MQPKTSQLQIRISPRQKAQLRRRAAAAGMDVSTFVLRAVLPAEADRFADLIRGLAQEGADRFTFAALNDLLAGTAPAAFAEVVSHADVGALSEYRRNYAAAMVEQAAHMKGVSPPAWTREIAPLRAPHFGSTLRSLRPHLLRAAPVAFKRRNIFVDSTLGDRV